MVGGAACGQGGGTAWGEGGQPCFVSFGNELWGYLCNSDS